MMPRSFPVRSVACVMALAAGSLFSTAALGQTIYFADIFVPTPNDGSIRKASIAGGPAQTVLPDIDGLLSVDVDTVGGKIYFTIGTSSIVKRCNLDGTGVETVASDQVQYPAVIRFDRPQGRVVWGDQLSGEIDYTLLSAPGTLTYTTTPFHRGLALDTGHDSVYWSTDIDSLHGNIIRGNNFGGNLTTIVTGVGKPAAVALDVAGGKIYWTDYTQAAVRRANLDGSNVQTLFSDPFGNKPRGIALDLAAGKMYWGQDVDGETTTGMIMQANLDGTLQTPFLTDLGLVQDLVIVTATPPPCYPNCDASTQSPVLNVADFTCFLQKFAAGDPYANCDASTQAPVLNVADFTCFLQKFAAGCT